MAPIPPQIVKEEAVKKQLLEQLDIDKKLRGNPFLSEPEGNVAIALAERLRQAHLMGMAQYLVKKGYDGKKPLKLTESLLSELRDAGAKSMEENLKSVIDIPDGKGSYRVSEAEKKAALDMETTRTDIFWMTVGKELYPLGYLAPPPLPVPPAGKGKQRL